MGEFLESEYWKIGIIWLVALLIGIAITLACVKGLAVWQERFGSKNKKPWDKR